MIQGVPSTTDVAEVTSILELPGTAGIPEGIPHIAEIPSTVDVLSSPVGNTVEAAATPTQSLKVDVR